MFDLTKQVEIEKKWQAEYHFVRALVYLLYFAGIIFFLMRLFFPSAYFDFFFRSPNATKNTIADPRIGENLVKKGIVSEGEKLVFDTGFRGDSQNYSASVLKIAPEKESQWPSGMAQVRKSFRAFFYPVGSPVGFKNGDLVSFRSDYYIVSQNRLRRFSSLKILNDLGYNQEAFRKVGLGDLSGNDKGEDVKDSQNFPDGSLIKVGEDYYRLEGGALRRFLSEKAYLTQYKPEQAVTKDENFLKNFEVRENSIGFADGTLISFDISVYVVEKNKIFPVPNPETFLAMGYAWNDVIAASEDELGFYKKGDPFTVSNPHPDGTIFFAQDSGKYYLIDDRRKREIKSTAILESYLRSNPITVQEAPLAVSKNCQLQKLFGFGRNSGCSIEISDISGFPGNDFRYELSFGSSVQLKTVNVEYKKKISLENVIGTLSNIKNRLLIHYGKAQ